MRLLHTASMSWPTPLHLVWPLVWLPDWATKHADPSDPSASAIPLDCWRDVGATRWFSSLAERPAEHAWNAFRRSYFYGHG